MLLIPGIIQINLSVLWLVFCSKFVWFRGPFDCYPTHVFVSMNVESPAISQFGTSFCFPILKDSKEFVRRNNTQSNGKSRQNTEIPTFHQGFWRFFGWQRSPILRSRHDFNFSEFSRSNSRRSICYAAVLVPCVLINNPEIIGHERGKAKCLSWRFTNNEHISDVRVLV